MQVALRWPHSSRSPNKYIRDVVYYFHKTKPATSEKNETNHLALCPISTDNGIVLTLNQCQNRSSSALIANTLPTIISRGIAGLQLIKTSSTFQPH